MSVRRNTYIITALFLCLITVFAGPSAAAAPVEPGSEAPDFTLRDLSGKDVALSDFRGKVVLLNFWGTFCPPCRAEMPALENVYRELKDRGFVVLAVSIDRSEKDARSFIAAEHSTFPVLLDSEKKVYYGKYATFALPLSYLIDTKGRVVEKYFGRQAWDSAEMKETIIKLIGEQK